MPHYKYQDVPGIDMLGESTTEYLTVKQCASVAHQFGKKEVLTETYGCTGWDFTFEGMKWVGDWQFVLGVNRMSKHLALYSLRGCRKRDYPPTFNYNNTWWEKNYVIEQYFARLSMMLQKGEPVRRILILHPMATAWCRLGVSPYGNPVRRLERDVPAINEYGFEFNRFLEFMSRQHIDYDLGDETLMASDGRILEDKLYIGEASYGMVIIPTIDTIKASTLELLIAWMDAGGHILIRTPLPYLVEGEESDQLERLFTHRNCTIADSDQEIIDRIKQEGLRDISITDSLGRQKTKLLCQYRRNPNGGCLFVVNNDRRNGTEVTITIPVEENLHHEDSEVWRMEEGNPDTGNLAGKLEKCNPYAGSMEAGVLEEWDPLTGGRTPKSARVIAKNGKTYMEFTAEFKECESKLFVWDRVEEKSSKDTTYIVNNGSSICCNRGEQSTGQENITFPIENANNKQSAGQGNITFPIENTNNKQSASPGNIPLLIEHAYTEQLESLENNTVPSDSMSIIPQCTDHHRKLHQVFPEECEVSLSMPNVLTLDKCRWRFAGEEWSEEMEVWRAQYEIRDRLGMLQVHRNGLEQRYRWIHKSHPKDGTEIELSFQFESGISHPVDAVLVVELAKEFSYEINGIKADYEDLGWFMDKQFRKAVSFPVREGKNEILMTCAYRNDYELEACYLLGDFGVSTVRKLTDPVTRLHSGDWTQQGLFHYPGKVVYHYEFTLDPDSLHKRWSLEIPDFSAVCVSARVNGRTYEIPWACAAEVDITDAIQAGRNTQGRGNIQVESDTEEGSDIRNRVHTLEVEVYASPRNMMGPFHQKGGKQRITNDACFTPSDGAYTEDYQVVLYGLNCPPRLYEVVNYEISTLKP
jgi:hypothetical protein